VPHRQRLTPTNPVPTANDMYNEDVFFKRKKIGEDDIK
jgi:hypothetical protein